MHLAATAKKHAAGVTLGFLTASQLFLLGDSGSRTTAFDQDEITVQRINVVEPDGSLAMVLSNSARMHPGQIGGSRLPERERPAGVLFFDKQGDEAGGLGIYGDETSRQGGFLIDQIGNDESLRFMSQQVYHDGRFFHQAGLSIADRNPELKLSEVMAKSEEVRAISDPAEQQAKARELQAQGVFGADRLFVGRRGSGEVVVDMCDDAGQTRLRLGVTTEGDARIEFLDGDGKVVKTLGADD